jgi:hypothetical protein
MSGPRDEARRSAAKNSVVQTGAPEIFTHLLAETPAVNQQLVQYQDAARARGKSEPRPRGILHHASATACVIDNLQSFPFVGPHVT